MERRTQRAVKARGVHAEPQWMALANPKRYLDDARHPYASWLQLTKTPAGWEYQITGYGLIRGEAGARDIATVQTTLFNSDNQPVLQVQWESPAGRLYISSSGVTLPDMHQPR